MNNQPVAFDLPADAKCCEPDKGFCQTIKADDKSSFQIATDCGTTDGTITTVFSNPNSDYTYDNDDSNGGTNEWAAVTGGFQACPKSKIFYPIPPYPMEEYTKYVLSLTFDNPDDCDIKIYIVGFLADGSYVILGYLTTSGSITISTPKDGFANWGFYIDGICEGEVTCPKVTEGTAQPLVPIDCILFDVVDEDDTEVISEDTATSYDGFVIGQVDWSNGSLDAGKCYRIKAWPDGSPEIAIYSQCFKLAPDDCGILVEYKNYDDAFGLAWPTGFSLQMRLNHAKIGRPKYGGEVENYRKSDGAMSLVHSDNLKQVELRVTRMPEYLHDALSFALKMDEIKFDSVQYIVVEPKYDPEWTNRNSQRAPVSVLLEEIEQGSENIFS